MAQRTQCPNSECRVVLNLPPGAEGRKLKCPRCGTKFRPGDPGSSARSSMPGLDTARPASATSHDLISNRDEEDLPVVSGELRESFDLPMLDEDNATQAGTTAEGQPPGSPAPSPFAMADAAGFLEEDEPVASRRRTAAEARAKTRRCPCGGVVPQGMSLCPRCGLDLETGQRTSVIDLLDEAPAAPASSSPPLGVVFVGVSAALVGLVLGFVSLFLYVVEAEGLRRWGYLLLAMVCAYAVYAAVRFLKGRSVRMLMTALMLGAVIDLVVMVILPITLEAVAAPTLPPRGDRNVGAEVVDPIEPNGHDPLADGPAFTPLTDRIHWRQVYLGLIILLVAGLVAVYLNSAEVRRHIGKR